MIHMVERHKKGWAAVQIEKIGKIIMRTVVSVYPTKAEAEKHWSKAK